MPGQGGVRAPLRRFIKTDGVWGYVIAAAHPGNGHSHTLPDYIDFPGVFDHREANPHLCNDTRQLMVEHHLCNFAGERRLYRDWKRLHGRYDGETLVIASCGPSLTHALPTLYRRRGEFRLMTVNRSHRAFQDREVRPDLHYFVERRPLHDWRTEIVDGKPADPLDFAGVDLITTPQADPLLVSMFEPSRRYWGWSSLGGLGDFPEVAALTSFDVKAATTIGNAPYIAWKLGFKRIILVGCDFALDCRAEKNEKSVDVVPRRMYFDRMWNSTHYAGTTPEQHAAYCARLNPMLGNGDQACMADAVLIGHCDYFQAALDIVHFEGGVDVVNATPRGQLRWNNRALEEALG